MSAVFFTILDAAGVELALFACAVAVYLVFSGRQVTSPRPKAVGSAQKQRMPAERPDTKKHQTKLGAKDEAIVKKPSPVGPNAADLAARAADIRACGKAHELTEAVEIFERCFALAQKLTQPGDGVRTSTLLVNSILEACVECGDLPRGEQFFARARASRALDFVSFNTLIKGYLAAGDEGAAKKLLLAVRPAGFEPSQATYHAFIGVRVSANDSHGAWELVEQMRSAGLEPNSGTCSILLRLVSHAGQRKELLRIADLVRRVGSSFDEPLLCFLVDACLKTRSLDLLPRFFSQFQRSAVVTTLSAPAYGNLIKAFGLLHDVNCVWSLWQDMLKRGVQPTEITLGCMVESLVANQYVDDAWQLVQSTWKDAAQRDLAGTVAVSTILKGYANQVDKTMEIYEIMRARGIYCGTITYNTILNTFAQSGEMHRAPRLLEDMKNASPPIEPDLVTYSTLIKGHCSHGNVSKGIGLFDEMRKEGKHTPDEMMYNSLLDGCAKAQRSGDALRLLDEMRSDGIRPSNFTLSILVKLLGRCKQLDQAFLTIDALAKEYCLKPNIQVYTCLIQACFQNKHPQKAIAVLDRVEAEGVHADRRTYGTLIRGCLQLGKMQLAAKVALRAYNGASPVGLDTKDMEELVRRLGAESDAAKAIQSAATASFGFRSQRVPAAGTKVAAIAPWRNASHEAQKKNIASDSCGSTTEPSDGSCSN